MPHAFTVSENSNGYAWTSDIAPTIQAMPPNDTMRQQYGVVAENEPIAFSCKDSGQDAGEGVAPTLRGMSEVDGNQNGGGQIAIAYSLGSRDRGDDGRGYERESHVAEEVAGTLDSHKPERVAVAFDQTQITHPENRSRPEPGDPCHPLVAKGHPPALAFEPQAQARRLTPREAERLQGFPDNFTLVPFGKGVRPEKLEADWIKYLARGNPKGLTREEAARLAADGNRYKALGNAMAAPVLYWIGWRVEIVEEILRAERERPDQAAEQARVEIATGKGASQDAEPVGAAPYYPFPNEADGDFPVSSNPKDAVGRRKVPLGLLPAAGKIHGALAAADGARKYGPYNWREHEVLLTIYLDAMERHIEALRDGQDLAPDSDVHHLGHVIACASIVLDALELGKLIDDRPKPGPAAALLDRHTKSAA